MADSDTISRQIRIGDWCFELKMVRALRVNEYGEPYSAIANCNINGNSMYVDGLMTKEGDIFSKDDFMTFYDFTKALGLDSFSYHRYHQGESFTKEVKVRSSEDSHVASHNVPTERRSADSRNIKEPLVTADIVIADVAKKDPPTENKQAPLFKLVK